ncbi:hypothetical protein AB0D32_23900 [Micromonospora sp. NPDC048170]|uniref:hypothetical protein n=1 Tax=Micromonospora sp. NPDC048170 TaxID=3154819 RepID=UPI0034048466
MTDVRSIGPGHSGKLELEAQLAIDLAFETQEREVLAGVADGIVAAAAGRALRVAVVCSPAYLTFAGQLTRALHARGRACRCITPTPNSSPPDHLATGMTPVDPAIAVIVGGPTSTDDAVYRVSVRLIENRLETPPSRSGDPAEGSRRKSASATDILLDYGDPNGPVVRHFITDEQFFVATDRAADDATNGDQTVNPSSSSN